MINIKGLNKAIKTFTQRITRKNKKSYTQLWAEKEVEIAKQRIMADCQGNNIDYDCGCYLSALKAFKSLIEDYPTFCNVCGRNMIVGVKDK